MKGGLGTMEAQMNIRRNAMEMQEYLSDLKVWEDSVKKKDKDLKKGRMPGSGSGGSGGGGTPAPRGKAAGSKIAAAPEHMQAPASQMHPDPRMRTSSTPSAATTTKKKKKKKKQQQGSDSAASHTYDNYRSKWEKFDVDAALAEADGEEDDEEESEEEEEEEAPQEAMPPIRKPLDADGWRSKGNEWFKMGDFRQAKDCYSSSIGAAPNSLAYANRAMACLKLGEHRTAEEDCTAAIGLDPLYLKSWQRRGAARKEQGRLQEAAADFEMALRLQPSSTALRAEFQACFDALQSERKLLPLRRRTEIPVRVSKEDKKQQQDPASSSAAAASASAAQEAPARGSGGAGAAATEAPSAAASSVRDRVAAAATGAAERVAKAAADHAPPKNSTEFETAWKSLRGDTAAQASYLRRIDPSALPVLFKTSLTGPLLNGIAAAALSDMQKSKSDDSSSDSGSSGGPDWAMDLLEGLTKVPRFDMTAMLLPRADKAALKSSIEACLASAASSPGLCGRLEAAKKKLKV